MDIAARRFSTTALRHTACATGGVALWLLAACAWGLDFGHARFISAPGQALLIQVPVGGMTAEDARSLAAQPAPAADWTGAGLVPPVSLDTLRVRVIPAVQGSNRRVLQIRSSQPFQGDLADLLLDVHTASSRQRYQVSLVAPEPAAAVQSPQREAAVPAAPHAAPAVGMAAPPTRRRIPRAAIPVRTGDTMLAISQRHAVDGVTVYQLMMALQRANPQAFIRGNINLVRAGSRLAVPAVEDMLSLSDLEARRQFSEQTAAFLRLRGVLAADVAPVQSGAGGAVSAAGAAQPRTPARSSTDALRLTGSAAAANDARVAQGLALKDAQDRVKTLEDNVHQLEQALQAQRAALGHLDAASPEAPVTGTEGTGPAAVAAGRGQGAGAAAEPPAANHGIQQQVDRLQQALRELGQVLQPSLIAGQAKERSAPGQTEAGDAAATRPAGAEGETAKLAHGEPGTPAAKSESPASDAHAAMAESRAQVARLSDQLDQLSQDLKQAQTAERHATEAHRLAQIESGIAELNRSLQAQRDQLSSEEALAAAQGQAGQLQERVKQLDQALKAQGEAARSAVTDGAQAVGDSLEKIAGAIQDAGKNANQPIRDSLAGVKTPADGTAASDAASLGASNAAAAELKPSQKTEERVSWLQNHLLSVMTALLAFIVLVIAWLLRRANAARDDEPASEGTTAAMVEEKLQSIDLDLDSDAPSTQPKG